MSGESWPDYDRQDWDADDKEIRRPPTTHFIATVDDVTDMLDFDSDDTDDMDVGAGDDSEPPPMGCRTATSSYDIYMVDTPKEGNGGGTSEDGPSKKKPKRRRQRRRSKSRHSKREIPAPKTIKPRTVPKTTPSSKIQHRRMEKPALTRERQTERSRTITIRLPPKTRQASATMNSPYRRISSNKSASCAGSWPRQIA